MPAAGMTAPRVTARPRRPDDRFPAQVLDRAQVQALVPCHRIAPRAGFVAAMLGRVAGVLIVDDGVAPDTSPRVDALGTLANVEVLHLGANLGKGTAISAGIERLLSRPDPPAAVLVMDADGQHPPAAIPSFLAAAGRADLVIGNRLWDTSAMPLHRRPSNRLATWGLSALTSRTVEDSQCGMRLLRGRALHELRFPAGRYEAETRHLKLCLREGIPVAWVPIPAIYDGEPSSFRTVRDTLRVAGAVLRPSPRTSLRGVPASLLRRSDGAVSADDRSALHRV